MSRKGASIFIASLLVPSILVGCTKGGDATTNEANTKSPEVHFFNKPTTIRMYQSSANISDNEFRELIAEPVKKKFPNVTMEIVRPPIKREDLISAGEFPDLVYTNTVVIQEYLDLKLPLDLNPLIKKYGFDLTKYNTKPFDEMRAFGDKGQLYGIPFSVNFDVLFYNKDIFDKFGVAYPKDGMTWDETIALGKTLTRQDNGVKYEGIYPTLIKYFATQLSVPLVNPNTLKAELTSDGWKKVFDTYKAIMDVQGGTDPGASLGKFNQQRTLAMVAHYGARLGTFEELHKKGTPVNWDMATYPSMAGKPGVSQGADTHYMMVSSTSKQPDAAFQVLAYLASEEAQTNISRKGRVSALKDTKIKDSFGADLETIKGKNIPAVFKSTSAPLPTPTKYDYIVTKDAHLQKYANEYLKGTGDVNTVLRQLEDSVNKEIEAVKQSGK
ncbi:MAG: family 1 extracellular solute-binding protein [Paenibacillus sp.]|nr:family 1 extracellular solute-binding protein [Paenibacillus sp.]